MPWCFVVFAHRFSCMCHIYVMSSIVHMLYMKGRSSQDPPADSCPAAVAAGEEAASEGRGGGGLLACVCQH